MYTKLNLFTTAHAMATHAGHRHAVIARNMAHADTPGYKAQDVKPFGELVTENGDASLFRQTRGTHMHGQSGPQWSAAEFTADAPVDPNGNSVSIEEQMLSAVDAKRQHDRAMAIYKSALTVLRTGLGRA
ncbi:MAG: FlgB family protein [Paracoccaceae bacterium]